MRKLLFIASIVVGAFAGLLFSIDDDWMTQVVVIAFGALIGTAVGGIFVGRGSKHRVWIDEDVPGMSASMKELVANSWRDRGHPPFAKPWDALPDRHMLDPDKVE
jgi:hypothetical protein